MLAFLSNILSHADKPIGTVLHIGAGAGSELQAYQELDCENIILIEPEANLFRKLNTKAKRFSNVQAIQKWIGEKNEKVDAQIFRNPRFNSLLEADNLYEFFPNLKNPEVTKVDTHSLTDFLSNDISLNSNKKSVLVIEIQGYEHKLLQSCAPSLLNLFSIIVVKTSSHSLYKNEEQVEQLSTYLNEISYDLLLNDSSHEPFIELYYKINKSHQSLLNTQKQYKSDKQDLEAQVGQLEEELAVQKSTLIEAEKKYKADKQQLMLQVKQLEGNLTKQNLTITSLQTQNSEFQTNLSDTNNELQTLNKKLEQKSENLVKLEEALKLAEKQNNDSIAKVADLTKIEQSLENKLVQVSKDLTEQQSENKKQQLNLESLDFQLKTSIDDGEHLRKENKQLTNELKSLASTFSELELTHSNLIKSHESELQENVNRIAELTEQNSLMQEQLRKSEEKSRQLIESILGLQTSLLKAQERINQDLENSTAESFKKTSEQITSVHDALEKRLDKSFLNTIKQVESFLGLQDFLSNGTPALEYHGWPISSDIALFLVNKVQSNNYDLIIEFGSGTSTVLFGKAVLNNVERSQNKLTNREIEGDGELLISPSAFDLPKRVVTFEHNKKYAEKTLASVNQQGVQDVVDLLHTPLVDFEWENKNYLYYACEEPLKNIAKLFQGRTAKILVLIDGPPAATGKLARFPAIPHLLNTLGNHQLHLVLDDFIREEEKQISRKWKAMFDERFISYEEELIPCEKGAWFCKLN